MKIILSKKVVPADRQGFTLIELLVVIAIIGLLSTLAVIALGSAREDARDLKRLSDVKQVQSALELYYVDNNAYPTEAVAITLGSPSASCLNDDGFTTAGCAEPLYKEQVQADPLSGQNYTYESEDGTSYTINFTLEGAINNLTGTLSATPNGIQ